MKNEYIILKIPIEPYLLKYVQKLLNVNSEYELSTSDLFGMVLYNLLQNQYYRGHKKTYASVFNVKISPSFYNIQKVDLTEEGVFYFNSFVKRHFDNAFIFYMQTKESVGIKKSIIIKEFCKEYHLDVDVDINFERLKKYYYRKKQHNKKVLAPIN